MLESQSQVRQICRPLFKKTGLTWFGHMRWYKDGHFFTLSSLPSSIFPFMENDSLATREEFEANNNRYVFFSPELSRPTASIDLPRYDRNILTGNDVGLPHRLFVTQKFDNFFEAFGFGSDTHQPNIFEYFVNLIVEIESFLVTYQEKAQSLISKSTGHLLPLPYSFKTESQPQTDETDNTNKINILTPGEKNCVYQIAHGKSYKETANTLGISVRTVESHLANIKRKLDCYSTSNIIAFFWKHLANK